ncbi:hypothetical protein O181_101855 [Austropuccinia psidii MF-1]|uniref:CCHC-type domain-containing protein n=1 Tax=Austropuccinia psidii MF-1 TaxID=1389203 RepID=A0A9Q3JF92_9BASI|nr:hypothetical protein [Austropuccinia psidii MF-1]
MENGLRRRCLYPCFTEEYNNEIEEIVKIIKIGRTCRTLDIKGPNKPVITKEKAKDPLKPNNTSEQSKCHKCGCIGHLANYCLKKVKINEIVGTEDHNDKEEKSDSEKAIEE